MTGVLLIGILFFLGATFEVVARMQARLERKNQELLLLHEAASSIYGELRLVEVLQNIVDQARQLLDARYGALSVVGEKDEIEQFVVSGVSDELRERIGEPPRGRGVLGVALNDGQMLRLSDIGRHPAAVGFPPNHPPMKTLLAVPVTCSGPFRGNLYLADKETAPEFTDEDVDTLTRFAEAAAIAIDSVDLHQRLQALAVAEERVRIAREMHDGMAQVVAYVNTKAQAVQAFLEKGKQEEAVKQLDELARASRDVYHEIREGITALRTGVGPDQPFDETLRAYVERWREQSGIDAQLDLRARPSMTPLAELQLLRILQESLSNVRKHARAARVTVRLSQRDGCVHAAVQDDGDGFDTAATQREGFPRFGLAIMRERAQAIGGELSVESSPGGGTTVSIEVPLHRERRQEA
jgi:nitrate/nitrite-specific signal transduction histidine kinase